MTHRKLIADSLSMVRSVREKLLKKTRISRRRSISYKPVGRLWKVVWVVPVLLLPVVIRTVSGDKITESTEIRRVLPVAVTRLQLSDGYSTQRVYTGEIVARRLSSLGFERSGTVTSLRVDEGDLVEAGAQLATLDVRELLAERARLEARKRQVLARLDELSAGPRQEEIAMAEAAVSDLKNQMILAQLQVERRIELYDKGAISAEALDERQFGANAIAARLQQAQSRLDELYNGTRKEQLSAQAAEVSQVDAFIQALDVEIDKSFLVAPFAGKISRRFVDEGAVVSGTQPVLEIVEQGQLEARIGVPESAARRLQVGDRQRVKVGQRDYPAVVTARLPRVDRESQTVTVVLQIADDDDLIVGATARLSLNKQQRTSGYWLPSTALVASERGLWSVYVLEKQDNAETYQVARRDVEVLYSQNEGQSISDGNGVAGGRAFVRGLVEAGDLVIASGTHRVVPGQIATPEINTSEAVQ